LLVPQIHNFRVQGLDFLTLKQGKVGQFLKWAKGVKAGIMAVDDLVVMNLPAPWFKRQTYREVGMRGFPGSQLGARMATTGVNGHHVAVRDGALAQTIGPLEVPNVSPDSPSKD
jgi:hypothetical protein